MHPAISASIAAVLVIYAGVRRSLSPPGLVTALLTAVAHAVHPWGLFIGLLATFFLTGTFVTKIKHAQKSTLTITASGKSAVATNPSSPPPATRTATQVLANSLPASTLILLHTYHLITTHNLPPSYLFNTYDDICLASPLTKLSTWSLLPYGVLAAYSTAAADTFASELGILSQEKPVLLTKLLLGRVERVPKGTNGGISAVGVGASALGAFFIGLALLTGTPLCKGQWSMLEKSDLVAGIMIVGVLGGLLDSLLGAWCQASVVERKSGKVIEGEGGVKVVIERNQEKEKIVVVGRDLLSNNGVNFVTGVISSVGTILVLKLL